MFEVGAVHYVMFSMIYSMGSTANKYNVAPL